MEANETATFHSFTCMLTAIEVVSKRASNWFIVRHLAFVMQTVVRTESHVVRLSSLRNKLQANDP